jgi:hypothetical protein
VPLINGADRNLRWFIEPTLRALRAWLDHRRANWPHSPNRHVLISVRSALATKPVSHVYVQKSPSACSTANSTGTPPGR